MSTIVRAAKRGLTIAIEGCGHGDLDNIYATMRSIEQHRGITIDLLICCGDFEAVRNLDDLECLACPPKYRHMTSYYRYYNGSRTTPYPTLFIGGNHEAANHLFELYYGGWVAPKMYYLGHAGVVHFGGIRIGGISGIYDDRDYGKGHFERPPFTPSSMRSAYHIRNVEVHRLLRIKQPIDVFLSHDWPTGIDRFGQREALLQRKPYFRKEMDRGEIGSPPAMELLRALRPSYWFSAHLHVKFAAVVPHASPSSPPSSIPPPSVFAPTTSPAPRAPLPPVAQSGQDATHTHFLALDKCLPNRDFLQVLHMPDADGPREFHYDVEWLAILRETASLLSTDYRGAPLPTMPARCGPDASHVDFVKQKLRQQSQSASTSTQPPPPQPDSEKSRDDHVALVPRHESAWSVPYSYTKIPDNFKVTAPPYDPSSPVRHGRMPQQLIRNPQTVAFVDLLGIPYTLDGGGSGGGGGGAADGMFQHATISTRPVDVHRHMPPPLVPAQNPEEIDLDDL